MKLLVFSPYYPPHTGGLESHSEEFNRHLSHQGVDITVFTPKIPDDTPEREIQYERVRILRYPAFDLVSNFPVPKFWQPRFWSLFSSLNQERYDFVISRTRFFPSSFIALVYAKGRGVKHIHIEHGSDFVQLSSSFKTFFARIYDHAFGRLIFRFSDKNVAISEAVKIFIQKFDKRPTPIIYRGIDFDAIDAVPENTVIREKYKDKIILVTAARLYKWKGVENTIEAIRLMSEEERAKIIFLIIGDGEDFQHLKKLSADLPIEMLGKLTRKETVGILKVCDIYIHSSLPGGGLSTALLEAMYCRCAIIATRNEGANEIISNNQNGLVVETSSNQIHRAVITLANEPVKRKSFSASAQRNIQENFSWNNATHKYLSVLTGLVQK